MEAELKNRARIMGAFTAADSVARMRYALRKAAFQAWTRQDWDFKASQRVIETTVGNLGPYTAPDGLIRFCTVFKVSAFGYVDTEILMPIHGTTSQEYLPYLRVQDGAIYFVNDPGTASLTLNYVGAFSNSIEEATLAASLLVFDDGLHDSIIELAEADLKKDLPGMREEAREAMKDGLFAVDAYWEEATRGKYQTVIAPKGLNRQPIDFYARSITVLGVPVQRFNNVL
jgi:hypothetical protein